MDAGATAASPALVAAIAACAACAESPELLLAVGASCVLLLRQKVDRAEAALSAPAAALEAAYELLSASASLASAVEPRCGGDGAGGAADGGEWGAYFGPAVAEATACALAAMAAALEAEACEDRALLYLQRASLDLDVFFAGHLFGELCRLELQDSGDERALEWRLRAALHAICAWGLSMVGRVVGYHRFSGQVLWQWASGDAFWACVFGKGALAVAPAGGGEVVVPLPDELPNLQAAVLAAALELASPDVLLAAEQGTENVPIAVWNAALATRRTELAQAAVSCELPRLLLSAAAGAGPAYGPGLAALLAAALQPELDIQELGKPGPATEGIFKDARAAAEALVRHLQPCAQALWDYLAQVPVALGEFLQAQFVHDCADLAYFLPPHQGAIEGLLHVCVGGADSPAALASLCVLMANARMPPAPCGTLERALAALQPDARLALCKRLEAWRGPVHAAEFEDMWAAMARAPPPPRTGAGAAEPMPGQEAPADAAAAAPASNLLGEGPLRGVLGAAPPELRCALSGRLLLDPVRTPSGHALERVELARHLAETGPYGRCPMTGQPLSLEDCPRDGELRRRVLEWVRQRRQRVR